MEYVLRTNNLTKKYKNHIVLNKVSINIKKGDIYGFIGKNGAGKTTLMRLITGLASISSGSIEIFGHDNLNKLEKERKRIGILIECPAISPNMTAYENMELVRLQKGIPGNMCIEEKLSLVGLKNDKKKKIKNFSLGMKQKLGLAMALLGDPEFLILDEPTNGLDPMGIVEMRELLKKLNKEKGITILISSHILSEVYQLANCYGFLNKGQLIEEITQKQLDERCKKVIELKVNNVEKATWVLENKLKTINFKVLPNNIIKLYDYIDNPGKVSKSLNNEDIIVNQIIVKGDELEDYFVNLMGGNFNG
ncbi:ATP-binding cassette domain-containing protein [Clostridium tarantellae]|uniref:ATP-binding cassette domain-containing protein n=1 Tax=Clostridium tarantellae TaxID=39493 RepID=A0A6I1MLF9_9CLOT|nr:ABC transporter ATP-binding protein [Clostridium tarantellae]MPQ43573.1 ATP-binding cassette domain-containing protein [Clostridium tarantellae]